MNTFAGFWRDGAVVKPEARHADRNGYVMAKRKGGNQYCCAYLSVDSWSLYYWLDTTTPTELTPQQAFECLKLVFPMIDCIERDGKRDYTMKSKDLIEANINWGELIEYPPRERWRVPTDADKGKRCRAWNDQEKKWIEAFFVATFEGKFVVKSGYWPFPVEVLKCEVLE
jgi:hypothetical protein